MKRFLRIILIIFVIFVLTACGGMFYLTRGLEQGSKLEIKGIDLSKISDGDYKGKYDSGRWSNEVRVTVKEHKITKIDVIKDVKMGKSDVTKDVITKVIEKQNTNVDAIAGATVTSKAYIKAIENALK